jgi:hypothetical protein
VLKNEYNPSNSLYLNNLIQCKNKSFLYKKKTFVQLFYENIIWIFNKIANIILLKIKNLYIQKQNLTNTLK